MPRGIYPRNQNRKNVDIARFVLVPKSDIPRKSGHKEINEMMEAAKKLADHDLEKAVVLIEHEEKNEVARVRTNAKRWIDTTQAGKYDVVARGNKVFFWSTKV